MTKVSLLYIIYLRCELVLNAPDSHIWVVMVHSVDVFSYYTTSVFRTFVGSSSHVIRFREESHVYDQGFS
jgi:hypothetical protein